MDNINQTEIKKLLDLYKSGHLENLQKKLKELVKVHSNEPFLFNMLGVVFSDQKKYEEAVRYFKYAISIKNNYADAYYNLGNLYKTKEDFNNAINNYNKAIKFNKNHAAAFNNLGLIFKYANKLDSAIKYFNKSITINPNIPEAYNNLGNTLKDKGEYDLAIKQFSKAIEIDSKFADAYNGMGLALQKKFLYAEAINFYKKAINIKPEFEEAHINLGYINLLQENYINGWKHHEYRKSKNILEKEKNLTKEQEWDGKNIKDEIIVYAEQGIGDQILFSSMLIDLYQINNNISVELEERLLPLYKRSFNKINFIKQERKILNTKFKKHIFMGSLGKFFRNSVNDFPTNRPSFLLSDNKKRDYYKSLLNKNSIKNIGISWHKNVDESDKNISLSKLAPIFNQKNCQFVDLQYGNTQKERSYIKEKFEVELIHFKEINYKNDIDELAAIISNCDLIITVANFTAQLAGALGVPTLLLLSHRPDWRWFLDRSNSLWYPNIKIFRQQYKGDWKNVIDNVKNEMDFYINKKIH